MEQEKNISPEESLNLIQKVIHSSQNKYSENGLIIMLWSGVYALISLADFIFTENKIVLDGAMLYAIPALLFQLHRIFSSKKMEHQKFISYADEFFHNYITGFFLTIYFTGVYANSYHIPATKFMLICLFGFCFTVSMLFNKNRFFAMGGAFMIFALPALKFVDVKYYTLVMSFSLLIGIFIPALLMYLKSKKESV